jgi:hypothetical protein
MDGIPLGFSATKISLYENSPAIYGWVKRHKKIEVPEGRQNGSFVPDGTWKFWRMKTHG